MAVLHAGKVIDSFVTAADWLLPPTTARLDEVPRPVTNDVLGRCASHRRTEAFSFPSCQRSEQ